MDAFFVFPMQRWICIRRFESIRLCIFVRITTIVHYIDTPDTHTFKLQIWIRPPAKAIDFLFRKIPIRKSHSNSKKSEWKMCVVCDSSEMVSTQRTRYGICEDDVALLLLAVCFDVYAKTMKFNWNGGKTIKQPHRIHAYHEETIVQ